MKRKFLIVLLLGLIPILCWMYRTTRLKNDSSLDINEDSIFYNYYYVKQAAITPHVECSENPFLTIIVTSYVGHKQVRSAHRRAMSQTYLKQHNTTRIFLLAQIPPTEKYITQAAIDDESNIFGDILQGTFVENYRNLTYKHLMGLHWSTQLCNGTYILKVDDDTVFNYDKTIELLKNLNTNITNKEFILGYMLNDTIARRNKDNKWFVTSDEYSYSTYPQYVSGWYYITIPKVAKKLVNIARYHKYFWIDDILVTGILAEMLEINLIHIPDNFWLEYYEMLECCIRDMIKKHMNCEYTVGPNGGRNNLILEFADTLKHCKINNCSERPTHRPLKKYCVLDKDRTIFSDGKPNVELIKL